MDRSGPDADPIAIRSADLADAPAMARVLIDTGRTAHRGHVPDHLLDTPPLDQQYARSARNWRRTLREIATAPHPTEGIFVAVDRAAGGRVVGLAMGVPWRHPEPDLALYAGEVNVLYVATTHQGRGIGRRLVRAVVRHLAGAGLPSVVIRCLAANAPARRFYEALGGQVVGTTVYEERGERLPEVVYGWPAPAVARLLEGD